MAMPEFRGVVTRALPTVRRLCRIWALNSGQIVGRFLRCGGERPETYAPDVACPATVVLKPAFRAVLPVGREPGGTDDERNRVHGRRWRCDVEKATTYDVTDRPPR